MRDCPMRVICCNSLTDSSSFSSKAMMRSRVGSARERRDFKTLDTIISLPQGCGTAVCDSKSVASQAPRQLRAQADVLFLRFQLTPQKGYISSNLDTSI